MSDLETRVRECKDEILDLSSNCCSLDDVKAVSRGIKENKSIQNLSLRSNNIGDEGAVALAEGIKVNQSITELDLQGNDIGAEGAAALAESIKENKSIQKLYLGHNKFGDEGAAALAEGIKENQSITNLNLVGNNIGDEGAVALAEGIKENKSIQLLNLAYNKIGDEGAAALAEGIKENKSITTLRLGSNSIGAEGAAALAEAIKVNQSIAHLNLYQNNIGDEGAAALAEGIKVNTNLKEISLWNNKIGTEGAAALAEAIKDHPSLATLYGVNLSNHLDVLGLDSSWSNKNDKDILTHLKTLREESPEEKEATKVSFAGFGRFGRSKIGLGSKLTFGRKKFGAARTTPPTSVSTSTSTSAPTCTSTTPPSTSASATPTTPSSASTASREQQEAERVGLGGTLQEAEEQERQQNRLATAFDTDQKYNRASHASTSGPSSVNESDSGSSESDGEYYDSVGDILDSGLTALSGIQDVCTSLSDWSSEDTFGEFLSTTAETVGTISSTASSVVTVIKNILDLIKDYKQREKWLDTFSNELSVIQRDLDDGLHVFDNHEFLQKILEVVKEAEATVTTITSRTYIGKWVLSGSDRSKLKNHTVRLNELRQQAVFSMLIEVKRDTSKTDQFHQLLNEMLKHQNPNENPLFSQRDKLWQLHHELYETDQKRQHLSDPALQTQFERLQTELAQFQEEKYPKLHLQLCQLEEEHQRLKLDQANLLGLIGFDDRDRWESKAAKGLDDDKLFPLDAKSPEYRQVESLFKETMDHMDIESIERIEHGYLHETFSIATKSQEEAISKLENFTWDDTTMKRFLFHGTSADAIDSILYNSGFVAMMNSRSLHGCGCYFATKASIADTYAQADDDGCKYIVLCSVAVGLCVKGSENQKKLPHLPGQQRRRFNSFVDNEENPSIFVIPQGKLAYPKYLIKYY